MEINILHYLPENTIIKVEDNTLKLFPQMRLSELSKQLGINLKNMGRYKNGKRGIPLILFKKLLEISNQNILDFQGKIMIKIGNTGDYLKIGPYLEITSDWIYISQLINGDGHIAQNLWHIAFVNNNEILIDYVYNFFKSLGLAENHFSRIKREDATFLIIRSAIIAVLLNQIFEVSIGKKGEISIPKFILTDKNFEIAAIRGAFDSEGCISFSGSRRISITSNSSNWIYQLNQILNNLKIKSRVFKEEKNRERPIYRLFITHIINIKKFYEIIKPLHSERYEKLGRIIQEFKQNYNNQFHKEILSLIKHGISRKRDIAKKISLYFFSQI